MNFIKHFFKKRILYHLQKKRMQTVIDKCIEKYNLNDPEEQRKIIIEHNKIQDNKRSYGRKHQEMVQEKISFMIQNELIKIK